MHGLPSCMFVGVYRSLSAQHVNRTMENGHGILQTAKCADETCMQLQTFIIQVKLNHYLNRTQVTCWEYGSFPVLNKDKLLNPLQTSRSKPSKLSPQLDFKLTLTFFSLGTFTKQLGRHISHFRFGATNLVILDLKLFCTRSRVIVFNQWVIDLLVESQG